MNAGDWLYVGMVALMALWGVLIMVYTLINWLKTDAEELKNRWKDGHKTTGRDNSNG